MNICKSEQEYLDQIIEPVRRCCKRYGYLPSILIAQSCLENGYGIRSYWDNPQIEALMKYNNMVGIKTELLNKSWTDCGLSVWPGKSLSKKTPEEYGGNIVTVDADFRKYDNPEQSFADFLCFMTWGSNEGACGKPKYGINVLRIKDPEVLIKTVNALGYASSSSYAENVMRIVRKHNLTKYDDLIGVTPTEYYPFNEKKGGEMSIEINRQYITTHNTNSTNDPVYIVIHNTDNFRTGADANAHAVGLYNGDMEGMSWHYVVDDHSLYQCIEHNRGAWHVGKNYGTNNLFGIVHNRNSLCIEICCNRGIDYEKAFQNAVALTKHLMKTTGITADRVLQHWDVCSKDCPSQIRAHGDWERFKKLISEDGGDTPAVDGGTCMIEFKMIGLNDNNEDVGTLQTMLNQHGCKGKDGKVLKVDNDFGDNTDFAVRTFQKEHGLKVDGVCGPDTWPVVFGKG